jgi:hypothetical protein
MKSQLLALLLLISASSAEAFQYWNDVRYSALLPDETVTIRVENPSGGGIENHLLYAQGGIVEEPMVPITDGPSTVTATVPGPVTGTHYYGFRSLQGEELDFMPVRIPDGSNPLPEDLTRVATDAVGDELFGYENLDLTDCRTSFSGTRLYAALTNAGGGFPVNQGLTFFGYLLGIADPADADPDTIFALMYTFNQPGIISPGLYKITGTGLDDLEKIGEVEVEEYPAENTLKLSCELADLLSDPDFGEWYDPSDPVIGVAGFTQRITFAGGADEADRTPGGRCYLRELPIDPGANQLPELRDLVTEGSGATAYAQVEYEDPDGNCPVLSEIVFDGVDPFPMYPLTLDYSMAVLYRTEEGIEPLASGEWDFAVARFSDNQSDVVEESMMPVAVQEPVSDERKTPFVLTAPNPFTRDVAFFVKTLTAGKVSLTIFDVSGRRVIDMADVTPGPGVHTIRWDGRDRGGRVLPAGTYFYRLVTGRGAWMSSLRLVR